MELVKKNTGPELSISEAKLLPQDSLQGHVRVGAETQLPLAALPSVSSCVPECKVVSYPVIPSTLLKTLLQPKVGLGP